MTVARIIPVAFRNGRIKQALCLAAYIVTAVFALQDFIQWDSLPFLLGLMALPFTVTNPQTRTVSYGWLAASAVCALLTLLVPVKTILFFSVGFAGFFLVQWFFGKPGFLSCIALFLIAPIFQYIADTFSFPIRLALTSWVVNIFRFSAPQTAVSNAVIHHNGNIFSVDPACMGLNMLAASLLLAVMLVGFYQKKWNKTLRWFSLLLFMALIVGLNIISNLIRIFLLVHFEVMPDTFPHDLIGLLCLAVYVALPAAWLAQYTVRRFGTTLHNNNPKNRNLQIPIVLFFPVLALVGGACYKIAKDDTYKTFRQFAAKKIPGYTVSQHKQGILKLENKQTLIYVKYVRSPFDTDHNPTLCWKGSGYTFEEVTEQQVAGCDVYTARLANGADTLYTAWWYSNGSRHTTSPVAWRRDMAATKTIYAVVNVTAATKAALERETTTILKTHALSPLFNNP